MCLFALQDRALRYSLPLTLDTTLSLSLSLRPLCGGRGTDKARPFAFFIPTQSVRAYVRTRIVLEGEGYILAM